MTRQENLIYRKQCPYDAMGDYSVLMENEKNIKTERNAKKSDLDIIKRCEKTLNFFETAQIPDVDSDLDKLYEFTDQVKTAFDELLNSSGASDVLFKNANPLTPRPDGTLHCQYVLDVLVDFVSKEFNTRIKKSSSRVKKYTDKYKSA